MDIFFLTKDVLGQTNLIDYDEIKGTSLTATGETVLDIQNGTKAQVMSWPVDPEGYVKSIRDLKVPGSVGAILVVMPVLKAIPFESVQDLVTFIGAVAWATDPAKSGKCEFGSIH